MNLDKDTGLPYTVNDLQMRLADSLVTYKQEPFYVNVIQGTSLQGVLTSSQKMQVIRLPDEQLDITPVPLGYVNSNASCFYVRRLPHRRYKQGLNKYNIRADSLMNLRGLLSSKYLASCIMGDYPSFEEAVGLLNEGRERVAFSRRFALQREPIGLQFLEYRSERCGWVSKGEPVLGEGFEYLKEELAKEINL